MQEVARIVVLLAAPHVAKFAKNQVTRAYTAVKKGLSKVIKPKPTSPSPSLEINKFLNILEVSGDVFVLEPLYVAIASYVDKHQKELGIKPKSLKMTSEAGFVYALPKEAVDATHNGNKLKVHFKTNSVRIETEDLCNAVAFVQAAKSAYKGGKELDMYS